LALAWLLMGNFEQGWREYEWRWKCEDWPPAMASLAPPFWDGSPVEGKTILLHPEQGLGDILQFIRYAALAKQRGANVLVGCPRQLYKLLRGCRGIDQLILDVPLPAFHAHAPLLSLPKIFGTTLATVPATVPYLFADAELTAHWRQELNRFAAFKIGISWQGNPKYRGDAFRSIPLVNFEPLARLVGVRLFSLQKGPGIEQLGTVANRFPVTDLGTNLDEAAGAFTDTAAIMKNLDLVVTSDTALAHLAGALGVPVWVGLPKVANWRWLLDREDSPWYPTMRLFRQEEHGNWQQVFERMASEVKKMIAW
jgi:hypothetical protein